MTNTRDLTDTSDVFVMTMLMRGILTYKSDVFVMMILMRGVLTDTSDDDAHVWYFD